MSRAHSWKIELAIYKTKEDWEVLQIDELKKTTKRAEDSIQSRFKSSVILFFNLFSEFSQLFQNFDNKTRTSLTEKKEQQSCYSRSLWVQNINMNLSEMDRSASAFYHILLSAVLAQMLTRD